LVCHRQARLHRGRARDRQGVQGDHRPDLSGDDPARGEVPARGPRQGRDREHRRHSQREISTMATAPAPASKGATHATQPFRWDDPFLIEDQLSDEERMIRDSARAFADEKLMPRVIEATRKEHFHREIMNEYGAMGFLGATIQGYGCAGVNYVCYG